MLSRILKVIFVFIALVTEARAQEHVPAATGTQPAQAEQPASRPVADQKPTGCGQTIAAQGVAIYQVPGMGLYSGTTSDLKLQFWDDGGIHVTTNYEFNIEADFMVNPPRISTSAWNMDCLNEANAQFCTNWVKAVMQSIEAAQARIALSEFGWKALKCAQEKLNDISFTAKLNKPDTLPRTNRDPIPSTRAGTLPSTRPATLPSMSWWGRLNSFGTGSGDRKGGLGVTFGGKKGYNLGNGYVQPFDGSRAAPGY